MNPLREAAQQALEALMQMYQRAATAETQALSDADLLWLANAANTPEDVRVEVQEVLWVRSSIAALRAALAQQDEPVEPVDVGLLEYRGNSVAFIHQKMTAYRTGIDAAWDAFRANGLHPDGKTSLADMIAKHTAPPQRTMVPLTEDEIYHATGHCGVSEHTAIKIARAVEQASWEKNHG